MPGTAAPGCPEVDPPDHPSSCRSQGHLPPLAEGDRGRGGGAVEGRHALPSTPSEEAWEPLPPAPHPHAAAGITPPSPFSGVIPPSSPFREAPPMGM